MLAMSNSYQDARGGKGPSAQESRPNANKGLEDALQENSVLPRSSRRGGNLRRLARGDRSRLVGRVERRGGALRRRRAQMRGMVLGVASAAVLLRRLLRLHFEGAPALPLRLRPVFRRPLRKARPHAADKRLGFSGDDAEDQLDSPTPRGEVFVYGDRVLRRLLPKRFRGEDRQGA